MRACDSGNLILALGMLVTDEQHPEGPLRLEITFPSDGCPRPSKESRGDAGQGEPAVG